MRSPLIQGRNARVNGRSTAECPHPEGSPERRVWLQAFEEAAVEDRGTDLPEGRTA